MPSECSLCDWINAPCSFAATRGPGQGKAGCGGWVYPIRRTSRPWAAAISSFLALRRLPHSTHSEQPFLLSLASNARHSFAPPCPRIGQKPSDGTELCPCPASPMVATHVLDASADHALSTVGLSPWRVERAVPDEVRKRFRDDDPSLEAGYANVAHGGSSPRGRISSPQPLPSA